MEVVKAIKCDKCGHLMEMPIKKEPIKRVYKKKKKCRAWTVDEDKYITDYYRIAKTKDIAKTLDRTKGAINARAHTLGIKKF